MYSSTLSLTLALNGGGWSVPHPSCFTPRPGSHCMWGWVGSRASLDGCRKSHPPTGIWTPGYPAPSESPAHL